MKSFTFPSAEETKMEVTVGDKTVIIDFFEYEDVCDEVSKKLRNLGLDHTDSRTYLEIMIKEMKDKFDLEFSLMTMVTFVNHANDFSDEVKKKLPDFVNLSDSTESTQDSSSEKKESVAETEELPDKWTKES